MSQLHATLQSMGLAQYLFALAFLTSYALALGGMVGPRGKWRAALGVLISAVGFTLTTDPWIHGALLMIFAVAGIGLFIVVAWLLINLVAAAHGKVT